MLAAIILVIIAELLNFSCGHPSYYCNAQVIGKVEEQFYWRFGSKAFGSKAFGSKAFGSKAFGSKAFGSKASVNFSPKRAEDPRPWSRPPRR